MDANAVLFDGSVIALVAVAITVCLDLFGFLNLMLPGAFVLGAAGAYAFAAAGAPDWQRIGAGALVAAIAGFAFDRLALDPLRRRGGPELMAISSLACSLIAFGILRTTLIVGAAGMPRSALAERVATIRHFTLTELDAAAVALCAITCTAVYVAVYRTRFGAGVRAAIENPAAARLMGIRLDRVPPSAMAALCAPVGMAGALFAMQLGHLLGGMPAAFLLAALAVCALVPFGSVALAVGLSFAIAFAVSVTGYHLYIYEARSDVLVPLVGIIAGLAYRAWRAVDGRERAIP